ncbi:ankyrin repeat-containing [Fusarium albosuccineum]|uniref:Ankyrin repeat-containing n=1 Tax=Fusarium albosuccineum TaxID=1237068 RepID=A0A8H4L8E1_9HYPO|nr:ankyrin repeat-containing [Fusarium albosuccineum]
MKRLRAESASAPSRNVRHSDVSFEASRPAGYQQPTSNEMNNISSGQQFNTPYGTQNNNTGLGSQSITQNHYYGQDRHNFQSVLNRCQQSLAFPEMNDRYYDIDLAAGQTCQWLMEHDMFQRWTHCDRGLLWVKGKPGSGKSTLMKFALDNLNLSRDIREGDLILSFFFHGRGGHLQKSPLGLFRSLIYQLLRQANHVLPELLETFSERECSQGKAGSDWNWHERELQDYFKSAIRTILQTRPVWLFVDALDEAGEENAILVTNAFNDLLQKVLDPSFPFHVCFSCRHYPTLAVHCKLEVCLEKENSQDIREYVQARLSDLQVRTNDPILAQVTDRSNGLFIWTRLVVDNILQLERRGTTEAMATAIDAVPQDLHGLYLNLTRTMAQDPLSLKLIEWICFARRPLSLDELRWAMIVEHDCSHHSLHDCQAGKDLSSEREVLMRRLRALSCGLIELVQPRQPSQQNDLFYRKETMKFIYHVETVQFIHQSVQDFFVDKGLILLTQYSNNPKTIAVDTRFVAEMAHYRLSRTCVRYMAMEEISKAFLDKDMMVEVSYPAIHPMELCFPLLSYAAIFWLEHEKQQSQKSDLLSYFHWPSECLLQRCARLRSCIVWKIGGIDMKVSPHMVHVLSRQGATRPLEHLIRRADQGESDINAKNERGSTALEIAVDKRNFAVIKLLLNSSTIDPSVKGTGGTPFELAIRDGNREMIDLFLENGAVDLNSRNSMGRTPLMWAISMGSESTSKYLLERGQVDLNAKDDSGHTALALASIRGYSETVRLLFQRRDVDVNATDVQGNTAFLLAAASGLRGFAGLFLQRSEVDIKEANEDGMTALLIAAVNGLKDDVEQVLRRREVDVNTRNHRGETALSLAAENGKEDVVELLLQRSDIDVNVRSYRGTQVLSYAAANGWMAVVELLLQRREVDINARTDNGETALLLAVLRDRRVVVDRLLQEDEIDANATSNDKETPLSIAVLAGSRWIVEMLLKSRRVDINLPGPQGHTPLALAGFKGREDMVKLFLATEGVDIDAQNDWGETPLDLAIRYKEQGIPRLLLEKGARRNIL